MSRSLQREKVNMGRGRDDTVQLCKAWWEYNGGEQRIAGKDKRRPAGSRSFDPLSL